MLTSWKHSRPYPVYCPVPSMQTLVAQDVLFLYNLLREVLGNNAVETPCYVYGDNAASLFLAQNNSVGQRTKHIDIRFRFLNDLVVNQKLVEIRHVRSENNTSDINSKNTKVEVHSKLADKLYEGLPMAEVDTDQGLIESTKEDIGVPSTSGHGTGSDGLADVPGGNEEDSVSEADGMG